MRKRKFATFIAPGLGKTLIDFHFALSAQDATGKRILIVCPLNIIKQVCDEAERFYGGELRLDRIPAAGLQEWICGAEPCIGITNYEAIREGLTPGNLGGLILIESSMLKSHYGKWGTRLIKLGKGLDWKLCETGTPAPNDRIEYANHAVFLDQCPNVNSFLSRFFVNRGQTQGRWELKPHALKPFYKALSHWSIFLTNPATYGWKDNAEGFPPIFTHIHDVPLTEEQLRHVHLAGGDMYGTPGGITSRAKLSQLAKGRFKGKRVETNKPAFIKDLAKSFGDESSLIWCIYDREQESMEEVFPDAASIAGKTPQPKREDFIAAFQRGEIKQMISKAKVLGFGLNLQIATRQIFSGLVDSYEMFVQCLGRSNRYGATLPTHAHIPVTDVERPMVETVLRKARNVQKDKEEQEQLFKEIGHAA